MRRVWPALLLTACGSTTIDKVSCVFEPVQAVVSFPVNHMGTRDVFDEEPPTPETRVDITDFTCSNFSTDNNTRKFTLMTGNATLYTLITDSESTFPIAFSTPLRARMTGLKIDFDPGGSGECTLQGKVLDAMQSDGTLEECGI